MTSKKPEITKNLKRIVLFIITLALTNCQDSENTIQQQSNIKTVSFSELKAFLTNSTYSSLAKSSTDELSTLDFDQATQEIINGSDQLLTVIPFSENNEFQNNRLLAVKIDNEIKTVIFSMQPDEGSNISLFSGKIFIYSSEWKFLKGFRAKEGVIISELVKIAASTTAKTIDGGQLQDVVVLGKPKLVNATDWDMIWGSGGSSMGYSPSGGASGMSWDATSSGGGSGSSSVNAVAETIEELIITDSLDDCPKKVFELLKKGTNASIAKVLSELGTSKVYNVKITSSSKISRPASSIPSGTANNYNIMISSNYTSATKLFRASNLLHEIVHCYFFSLVDEYTAKNNPAIFDDFPALYQKFVDKKYPGSKDAAHHDAMAKSYVDAIGAALQEFDTGKALKKGDIPDQIYTDLAWGGLQEAPIFQKKFPVNSVDYNRIIGRYNGESVNSTINGQKAVGEPCK
ncbi:hypothetical protein K6T82_11775 [Flavobacterium sp. 17A]|uniref:Uncharacterized protein n=1 Tax=Flavobacterium potami TaxID=2872310 RepID=A0A9X1HBJ8_9FLAO|nr:hypothetical protein [Flavobacterium potami]MBZ4035449.1 hypothetical protein [Flavobacterium potami]